MDDINATWHVLAMYSSGELPRRRFLGLRVIESAPSRSSTEGSVLRVREVLGGGAAAAAGVEEGDALLAVDGERVRSRRQLADVARHPSDGSHVSFLIRRGREALERSAVAPPLPRECLRDGAIELGHVVACGARLRTITSVPSSPGPHAAILFLPGIRAQSCEYPLDQGHPIARLVDGWTSAGFLLQRVERCGIGDSDGPPPEQTDLGVELDGYDAALDALLSRDDVDRSRVFLFGHSFGGMLAPLIAAERGLAGVLAFGSSADRWHDCVAATNARRRRLAGVDDSQPERAIDLWLEMHLLVCRGAWTPGRLFESRPELRALRSRDCDGETLFGRHVSLFQQLDAVDLRAAWGALQEEGCPVLGLHGEYDWVCGREGAEGIAAAAGPLARSRELASIGHDLLSYPSQHSAYREAGRGRWDGAVLGATVGWMVHPASATP